MAGGVAGSEIMSNVTPTIGKQLSQQELTAAVEDLLAEGTAGAIKRERSEFDRVAGSSCGEIVLFGAGGLGRRTLSALRKIGFEPLAFSDSNSLLWNTSIDGTTVLSPEAAAGMYRAQATFVITIWGALGTYRMVERQERLRRIGCQGVVPFTPLFSYQLFLRSHDEDGRELVSYAVPAERAQGAA